MVFFYFFSPETIYTLFGIYIVAYFVCDDVHNLLYWSTLFMRLKLFNTNNNIEDDPNNNNNENNVFKNESITQIRYEDKYLEDVRKLPNEFCFNEQDIVIQNAKFNEFLSLAKQEYYKQEEEIKDKIAIIDIELEKHKESSDEEFCKIERFGENLDDKNSDTDVANNTNENIVKNLMDQKLDLKNSILEIHEIIETPQLSKELINNANEYAKKFVIDERLDKLKNSYVIEKTPLGNILMVYNNKRGSFEYYSDNTIPYRYLEPVSRKYVKIFNCRPIYFDMEEELKNYQKKLEEKEKQMEKEKEEKEKAEEKDKEDNLNKKNNVIVESKKNVFAKFKSYNKEAGTGHVNVGAPPKNSIPNNKVTDTNNNGKVILKENANRYSYEGKMCNFSFLKKIDRKVVDKKYAMTFADFKRLQDEKKIK
jgi:hypothetical protein